MNLNFLIIDLLNKIKCHLISVSPILVMLMHPVAGMIVPVVGCSWC